jgi:hypothetical protein
LCQPETTINEHQSDGTAAYLSNNETQTGNAQTKQMPEMCELMVAEHTDEHQTSNDKPPSSDQKTHNQKPEFETSGG